MTWRKPVYNAEGYVDMTAFAAIKNVYEGDYKMTGWNDGDIVKLRLPDGRDVYRVVLKAHGKYATTLNLFPNESEENEYKIKPEKDVMHADLGKIAFTRAYDLDGAQFIRAMDDNEFSRLMSRVGDALGVPSIHIPDDEPFKKERDELKEQVENLLGERTTLEQECSTLKEKCDELEKESTEGSSAMVEAARNELEQAFDKLEQTRKMLKEAQEENADAKAAVIKAEAERDVYKDLYKSILVKHGL